MTGATGSSIGELLDAAVAVAGSDAASVQIADAERDGLRLAGWRGFHSASAEFWELVVRHSSSSCGMALAAGGRVVIPDVEADARLAGSENLVELRRSGLRAVQSTPLVTSEGRIVGMLSTHWRAAHQPSVAELGRIDVLAATFATAVTGRPLRPRDEQPRELNLIHEVNEGMRRLAARFASTTYDDPPQPYLCECGCGAWVAFTGSEFDARLAAQTPIVADEHVVARARAARRVSRLLREDAAALRAEALQKHRRNEELAKQRPKPPDDPERGSSRPRRSG